MLGGLAGISPQRGDNTAKTLHHRGAGAADVDPDETLACRGAELSALIDIDLP